jgi:hypothetical protein
VPLEFGQDDQAGASTEVENEAMDPDEANAEEDEVEDGYEANS